MYISDNTFTVAPAPEGREEKENAVYSLLDSLGVAYEALDHDKADTMEICEIIEKKLGAKICKNLFLCNRQQTDFYLLMMPGSKVFKTKYLSEQIGSSRLSFAGPEFMREHLNITPGSVSVFGLMNDKENKVTLIIDNDLLKEEYTGCHPCVNTSVLKIKTSDLLDKVIPEMKKVPLFVNLPDCGE